MPCVAALAVRLSLCCGSVRRVCCPQLIPQLQVRREDGFTSYWHAVILAARITAIHGRGHPQSNSGVLALRNSCREVCARVCFQCCPCRRFALLSLCVLRCSGSGANITLLSCEFLLGIKLAVSNAQPFQFHVQRKVSELLCHLGAFRLSHAAQTHATEGNYLELRFGCMALYSSSKGGHCHAEQSQV